MKTITAILFGTAKDDENMAPATRKYHFTYVK